jgi:hypothetical protein
MFDVLRARRISSYTSLTQYCSEEQEDESWGPYVITEGMSYQFFFAPLGLQSRSDFIQGCDWLGRGGFVVAPPSFVHEQEEYLWAPKASPREEPLANAPDWLIEQIQFHVVTC